VDDASDRERHPRPFLFLADIWPADCLSNAIG
jgi:hypothetical protein